MLIRLVVPLALVPWLSSPFPASAQGAGCVGCVGVGGTASASGGTCGGVISITVNVESGKCKWVLMDDPPFPACVQKEACKVFVTRTWTGLPPDTALDFCVEIAGETLCLEPPPSSGSGSGSDTRQSADLGCTGVPRGYSFGSSACGLSAGTEGVCSVCEGL